MIDDCTDTLCNCAYCWEDRYTYQTLDKTQRKDLTSRVSAKARSPFIGLGSKILLKSLVVALKEYEKTVAT